MRGAGEGELVRAVLLPTCGGEALGVNAMSVDRVSAFGSTTSTLTSGHADPYQTAHKPLL